MRLKTNESIICSRCLIKSRANGDLTARKRNTPMHATTNELTNTPQEVKAIKCMEVLNIYKPYIDIFKKHKTLCLLGLCRLLSLVRFSTNNKKARD